MVSAARTEGPGMICRELVLPPQSFEAAEQTPVSESKEHRTDLSGLCCRVPNVWTGPCSRKGLSRWKLMGMRWDSWEKALFGKGRA